jgi:glutaryl-CoA dehydrogenase
MFAFRGVDYMEIDSLFSDQEKLVRQTVREFVEKEVIPHIEEWNREAKFPRHLVEPMASSDSSAQIWKATAARGCRTWSTD